MNNVGFRKNRKMAMMGGFRLKKKTKIRTDRPISKSSKNEREDQLKIGSREIRHSITDSIEIKTIIRQ